jgi:hypothetical protein
LRTTSFSLPATPSCSSAHVAASHTSTVSASTCARQQHTSACVSKRHNTSAYVSIRRRTSAYVSKVHVAESQTSIVNESACIYV